MRVLLVDTALRAQAAPKKGRIEIADLRCQGLTFRITKGGVRSWSFRFRDPVTGKMGRVTLGRYPDISLAAARKRGEDLRAEVAGGINPSESKRRARADAATKTFGALAARYIAEHAVRKKRSFAVDSRNLRLHVLPKWENRSYAGITRGDVIELLEGIVADGKPVMANRVQSLISAIFSFAIDAGLRNDNPCTRLRKRGEESTRDRVLSDSEIPTFWNAAAEKPLSRRTGSALQLVLLTGGRVNEIAGLQRSELENLHDEARAGFMLPAERVKNKRPHFVPLSPLARRIVLDALALLPAEQQSVFPDRSGNGPMKGHSLTNAFARLVLHLAEQEGSASGWSVSPPTSHDLRRTVETKLSSLGIPKEDRDAVLNHVQSGIGAKHYDRYDRAAEKRRALNILSTAIEVLLTGDQGGSVVVAFNGGARAS